jgi:hypothetical protein
VEILPVVSSVSFYATDEITLYGYRALTTRPLEVTARVEDNSDFTRRYPEFAKALQALTDETLIDGEVVAMDADGRPSTPCRTTGRHLSRCCSTRSICWCWRVGA